jgi:signal transduction histidine kinase
MKSIRNVSPWFLLGIILVLLLIACAAFILDHWRKDAAVARETAAGESKLLASLLHDDLRRGNFEHVPQALEQWGGNNHDVVELRLTAANGYVLGEYRREAGAANVFETSVPIKYSYRGEALLTLVKDRAQTDAYLLAMFFQLGAAYLVLAALLIALTKLMMLHRREAVELRRRTGELDRMNAALQTEVDRRTRAQAELQRYRGRLEDMVEERTAEMAAAIRELEAFSYSVSHDLRGPLRGIDGFSLILLEDYGERLDDAGREHLRRIRAGTQRLGKIIDDLLQLARVTRTNLEPGPVDLSVIAADVVTRLRERHPERTVAVDIQPNLIAFGNRDLLATALENLLGNAWKYTGKRDDARIAFGGCERDRQTIYFVRDNGAGFEMQYADKLFSAFQRLHHPRDFDGTGIGLATVQRIIHRHGGRVWAEAAPEQGATFYFTLGRPQEAAETGAAFAAAPDNAAGVSRPSPEMP